VYTVRPIVSDWLQWRDVNFEDEMQNWVDFIVFWMEGEGWHDLTYRVIYYV
jgi:hypothetical protein